ncbi:hypothetical protein FG93_02400 [Bosea sp. LC85]|uniref:hypothetical protein n=1 Tax=Bosea sp. LC85 TaxID=1502851 RepID=UPI0004E34CCF|nr:hypothetical protein [Bosea sp. LC85]KFC71648.1 hypothetical protein FG93_02400 [Bosea sp. LC85]
MLAGVEGRVSPCRYPGTELSVRVGMFIRTQRPPRAAPVEIHGPAEKLAQALNAFTPEVVIPL